MRSRWFIFSRIRSHRSAPRASACRAEGRSLVDAIYFSVLTIATVGFGDLAPKTTLGKLFTVGYVVCGLGLFVATAPAIADGLLRDLRGTPEP